MDSSNLNRIRHILIAVDESENAERAVRYVAAFLGNIPGFHVTLLNIVMEPSEDYVNTKEERQEWIEEQRAKAEDMVDKYRMMLLQAGFEKNKIAATVDIKSCLSIAQCILDAQDQLQCSTVVIGRRGISKKEEFIFGSTSNKILHIAKNCSVWVIE